MSPTQRIVRNARYMRLLHEPHEGFVVTRRIAKVMIDREKALPRQIARELAREKAKNS